MKYIIVFIVHLYWKIAPKQRRVCLYSETCSHYVERVALHYGFIAAVYAFINRLNNCNSEYQYFSNKDGVKIVTRTGFVIEKDNINPRLLSLIINK